MDYKIITDETSFIAERQSWNGVLGLIPDATPFQTWEWNFYWWKHNEQAENLYVIKAFEGERVFGYAPLVIHNKTAEFIGGRDMDYGGFVVSRCQIGVIEGFVKILLEQGFGLAFQEMASRNTQLHMVQRLLEEKKRYLVQRTTRASYVRLDKYGSVDSYMKFLSQSLRNKTIKAGLKKGLQMRKEPITDKLFEEISAIYESRQEHRGGAPDVSWSFEVIRQMSRCGLVDVYIARDNETAVGFLVAFCYEKVRYIWLVAFRMNYREWFPGYLLFYQVIADSFAEGYARVDFMRGDYDFKLRWECELDTNYTVYVCRTWTEYWKKKLYFAVKPVAKKIIYSVPILERIYRSREK